MCYKARAACSCLLYQTFQALPYGQQFTVRTDHKDLKWLPNFKDHEGQLARWLTQLAEFNFTMEHRDGKKHSNADSLSRLPCRQGGIHTGLVASFHTDPVKEEEYWIPQISRK